MLTRRQALERTFAPKPLRRSIAVAIVIGTALNIINQGLEVASGQPLIVWKLALTYFVPFAVASYGCYSAFRSAP